MIMVSDGVSSILSDDEIVDLARDSRDPKAAAERILSFSQDLGGDDNATVIVAPLPGWGRVSGPDKTKELREYRQRQASRFRDYLIPILCTDELVMKLGVNANVECKTSIPPTLYLHRCMTIRPWI